MSPLLTVRDLSEMLRDTSTGHIRFRRVNLGKVPSDKHGVYSFWYRRRCIYVGMAPVQPIRRRLEQHWAGSHNALLKQWIDSKGEKLCVEYVVVPDIGLIAEIEQRLIKLYQPLANKNLK